MDKLIKLFENIFLIVRSYPITIFYTLFLPSRLISEKYSETTCPPSLVFIISLFITFAVGRIKDIMLYPDIEFSLFPSKDYIVIVIIAIALLTLFQILILKYLFRLKNSVLRQTDEMQYLTYPISTAMLVYSVTVIISYYFPDFVKTIAPHLDREAADISSKSIIFAADIFSAVFFAFTYILAYFNVIRIIYKITAIRSFITTILSSMITLFVTAFLLVSILFYFEKIGEEFEKEKSIWNEKVKEDTTNAIH